MANTNFVVHNGLTVGPLTINATTGVIAGGALTGVATGAFTSNVIGGLAQFASLNSTPIGNATASSASFTTINASGYTNLAGNVSSPQVNAGAVTTTGDVVVGGDLTVNGTETTVNTATLNVTDKNITIADGAADSAAADGAGLTVDGASATFTYTHSGTKWNMNKSLDVTGSIIVSGTVDGVDIAARDAVLSSTKTTADAALPKAGGTMTGDVTVTGIITPDITKNGSNGAGDIGQTGNRFAVIYGQSTSAQYADLAEKYEADAEYAPGTVVHFGGEKEVAGCDVDHCTKVAGVVSTNPAYKMNDTLEAEYTAMVALTGRVPCKVTGAVAKGDMMVSAGNGHARAEADPKVGAVIGKALEAWEGGEGVIEVVVGKH
jgi:hypothetical protein